ncbi:unnamed protein product [Sphagnum balticum]
MEPSSMTYDEAEMQRSHHFMQALKELRNLRPQLYSAAEYCESSYLYSDQKQVVLENLKDYSVKALVNAVDHLGTVAYKLNDLLNQQTAEISSVELRAASLAQRMRSCQEHSDREGLKQQSLAKTMHVNHKHYVLPGTPLSPPPLLQSKGADTLGTNRSKTAEWHFASDAAPVASTHGSFTRLGQEPVPSATRASMLETSLSMRSFLTSFNQTGDQMPTTMDADLSTSNSQRLEKVGMMRSGSFAPTKSAPPVPAKASSPSFCLLLLRHIPLIHYLNKGLHSIAFTHSTTMLPIQTLPENGLTENSRPAPTRSKSLLRSLLQRRKSSSSSKTTNAS